MLKKHYLNEYYRLYKKIDQKNWTKLDPTLLNQLSYRMKKNKMRLRYQGRNKDFKNNALVFVKYLEKSHYKKRFIEFLLSNQDQEIRRLTLVRESKKFKGVKMAFLPASTVHQEKDILQEQLKTFLFQFMLSKEDDEYVFALRKWIKKNRELVEQRIGPIEGKITRIKTLNLAENLYQNFSDRPWEESGHIVTGHNKRRHFGKNKLVRTWRWFKYSIKNFLKIENISSLSLGTLSAVLTGMPYIGSAVHSVVKNILYPIKHQHNVGEYLKKNLPLDLLSSASFASGFAPGRIPHKLFMGTVFGSIQAAINGRPIGYGALSGALTQALWGFLPPQARQWVISGDNKDFVNALLELTENMTQSGIRGMLTASLDDGDILKGFSESAKFALIETAIKISIYGFRFRAMDMVSDEFINSYEDFHNGVLSDRTYNGNELRMNRNLYMDVEHRKNALFRRIIRLFNNGDEPASFHVFGNSSLSENGVNIHTIVHESLHYGQEMYFGSLNFFFRYIKASINGFNYFEDYN
jgi:hypothetical protein